MKLILFSVSFPYVKGGDANFLNIEVQHLSRVFDKVVIVPEVLKAPRLAEYDDFEVVTEYAELLASKTAADLFRIALTSPLFVRGLFDKNFFKFSLNAWRRLIAYVGKAELLHGWLLNFLRREGLETENLLFYTYWFDNITTGVGLLKEQYPELHIVSRAHNYDIYEELYYTPSFFPCREFSLNLLDKLFACSNDGATYMREKYPAYKEKITTSLLGVADPEFLAKPSKDGVFRIVSCSFFRPEKRISLLLNALIYAAKQRPDLRLEWYHIGNGSERIDIQQMASKNLPSSAKAFFVDYVDNRTLMDFYRINPVDVFMNVSSTEGIPVAIMEAASCGIPIVATAVGGNSEIVLQENGYLLSSSPTLEEISSVWFQLIDNPAEAEAKRLGSRQVWETNYNAQANFSNFVETLRKIVE